MKLSKALFSLVAAAALMAARAPVYPVPDAIVPDFTTKTGQEFTARPGDVVLRARVVRTEKSYLDDPVHVELARFSDDLEKGAVLTSVVANDETKKIVGSNAEVYYCGDDIKARSNFMAVMLGDMGSKFENIVRFCFIDDDTDGRLDHYFLAGSKDPVFLKQREIEPFAFHTQTLVLENEADEVRLRYRKFEKRTTEMHFQLEITRNGEPLVFEYIITPSHLAVKDQYYYRMVTDPQRIPYPVNFYDILGANVGIRSVTADGDATMIINRNFDQTLIKPYSPQTNYIFIYI